MLANQSASVLTARVTHRTRSPGTARAPTCAAQQQHVQVSNGDCGANRRVIAVKRGIRPSGPVKVCRKPQNRVPHICLARVTQVPTSWSDEDDAKLQRAVRLHGTAWRAIAKGALPGRTAEALRLRWRPGVPW